MALLLVLTGVDSAPVIEQFKRQLPDLEVRVYPDCGRYEDIRYALVWAPPSGLLGSLPNLQIIFSFGAGVDSVLGDPLLPDVALVKLVDQNLNQQMSEYIILQTLMIFRQQRAYDALQRKKKWQPLYQPLASDLVITVMGLGGIGRDVAKKLLMLGFNVLGWSKSEKTIAGLKSYSGDERLMAAVSQADILVCLLPLTRNTKGILNSRLFTHLKSRGPLDGVFLINAGRGELQNESDILSALNYGLLKGVVLDVCHKEPLPTASPLWDHPKVTITPHIAAITRPQTAVASFVEQINRFENGQPLEHMVDRNRQY